MNKLFIYVIIAMCLISCKNRKLSIDRQSTKVKTEQKEDIQTRTESTGTKQEKETSSEKISDQSGTWIWEEWYRKDLESDTINPVKGLIYKRTTYLKNDITTDRLKTNEAIENHSEIKDTSVLREVATETKTESKTKNLKAEKSNSWIYGLTIIIVLIGLVLFALKRS